MKDFQTHISTGHLFTVFEENFWSQRQTFRVQAMGANGLRAEYPLARHLACAKIAAYTDGSIEMMNERIGAGLPAVFGKPG